MALHAWVSLLGISILSVVADAQCPESDILHFDWEQLNTDGSFSTDNWPDYEYEINFDQFNLEIVIDVNLTYLGYSLDKDGNELGTTYVLDFASEEAHIVPLNEPGTCSNRVASDFETAAFDTWWTYSTEDPPVVSGGDSQFLAYPPGGDHWFIESSSCSQVHYHGHFTYKSLFDECTNYDGSDKYSILSTDEKWINLTLIFYINIVSPLASTHDTGYYRIYQLVSAPFILAIHKTVEVLQPIGIRLFTMSIIAVYKENQQNDFRLVVVTETSEYLKLKLPQLVTYPWDLQNDHLHFLIDTEAEHPCLNNKAYFCSQIWEIYANDVPCPPSDFSGVYGLQFQATCNNDSSSDEAVNQERSENCEIWLTKYDQAIDLSADLVWVDEICDALVWDVYFGAQMSFYADETYSTPVDESHLYRVGEDRIYVEVEVEIPSGAYDVFAAELVNVWLCTTDPLIGEPALDETTGDGGCLANNIDDDGPYFIMQNYDDVLLYNATHEDEGDADKPANVVRFSFISPVAIVRDKLYIHCQLRLSLNSADTARRRLLDEQEESVETTDQIKHFIGTVQTDVTNSIPYKHIKDIDEYKRESGFYDTPVHENDENNDWQIVSENENGARQPPNDGGLYILISGDAFNTLKIVTVVIAFLLVANVCYMVFVRYEKRRQEEHRYFYNAPYSE